MKRSPVFSLVISSLCVSSLGSSPSYFPEFATVLDFTYPFVLPLLLLDITFRGIAVFAASFVSVLLLLFYFLHFSGCIVVFHYMFFLFQLVLYEDACRDAVRMIPPSWSLIKWLYQKPSWNLFY